MEYSAALVTLLTLVICKVGTCSSLSSVEEQTLTMTGSETGQLSVKYLQPCNSSQGEVKQFETDVLVINENLTLCNMSTTDYQMLVFRVETIAPNASDSNPVVFVTRNGNNVENWQLPLKLPSLNVSFNSTQRTICTTIATPSSAANLSDVVAMYVDVFASSRNPVNYTLTASPVSDFILTLNASVNVTVLVNGPQLHYFKYPEDVSSVTVEISSSKPGCMVVSVQNFKCPVNDLLGTAQSKGVYQTMKTSASLSITAGKDVSGDSFFVALVIANFSKCWSSAADSAPGYNESQTVTIKIEKLEQASEFKLAIVVMLLCFVALGIITCCCLYCQRLCLLCTRVPYVLWTPTNCRKCISLHRHNDATENVSEEEPLVTGRGSIGYGAAGSSSESENDELLMSGKVRGLLEKAESKLSINDFLKQDMDSLQQQYSVYGWNTITVGIFYALPAFQLVLAEQIILNASGDQDICYYNFKCAHPYGVLSAFNNIWSNIGYFILGLSFLIIVWIRHSIVWKESKRPDAVKKGVPHFFGIYYAMGIALVTEGFMSAFYHICPSNSNFQFDTAFMFIIGGLLIVKVLQARHPTIHADAFIAFFSFAVVIFMTLIAIWESNSVPTASRITVLVLVLVAVSLFCLSFYFYHDWTLVHWIKKETYVKIYHWLNRWCIKRIDGLKPRHSMRFLRLITVILFNFGIGIGLVVKEVDVASIILGLFVVNFIIFMATYIGFKLYFREPFTFMPVLCLILNGACWFTAFFFYYQKVSDWAATPAESRYYNQECVFMKFYDYHDVWHFFSACAVFFSFIFVFTLDDGLQFTPRENIHVF